MIFNRKSSKFIAAVLTAALALSPVFVSPISADDGQDVETQANSWRYQDGDIIIDEGLEPMEADTAESAIEADKTEEELQEDYNAQMGSSMREEESVEGQMEEQAAEPEEMVEPEGTLIAQSEAQAEAPADVPAAEAASPELSAKSDTVLDRYWTWDSGKIKRGPGYLKGIDVSYWQGKIDWAKVKAAGVDFAILRCGYGSNTSSNDDSTFAANVRGCVANGIPYGVYLYSYANTVSGAQNEADHAIRLLRANSCSLQYPVYYDLEDSQVAKASNTTIRSMANAFCSKLKNNGYAAGVYANLNWWNNKLNGFDGYDKWVAQWAERCTYGKEYSIWQCTSSTSVNGISGRVDANLLMCPRSEMDTYMIYGAIRYSITTIDGEKYIISNLGEVLKNQFYGLWPYIYGLDENGVMQTGKKFWIGSKAYILDGQGRAYINKSKTKKKKVPYYAKPGSGQKGKIKKKGTSFYVLRTSGKWSQMANGYWIKTSLTKKTVIYPEYRPSVSVTYKAKLKKKTASRSGPSNGYIKKKTFKKNKTVTVIGTYGGWAKISSGQWLPLSRLKK